MTRCMYIVIPSPTDPLYDWRDFSVTAPRLCNDLPDSLRHIDSFELFKSNLKTRLFKAAFINYF